jgi:hypothetical protein
VVKKEERTPFHLLIEWVFFPMFHHSIIPFFYSSVPLFHSSGLLTFGHLGIEGQTESILEEVEPKDQKDDRQPGKDDQMRSDE